MENLDGLCAPTSTAPDMRPAATSAAVTPSFTPGWHVVSSDWEPGSVTWYYDGIEIAHANQGDHVGAHVHRAGEHGLQQGAGGRDSPTRCGWRTCGSGSGRPLAPANARPRPAPRDAARSAYSRLSRCSARAFATAGDGTTTTGRSACWRMWLETLPSISDLTRVKPRLPRHTASAASRAAALRMASATVESTTAVSRTRHRARPHWPAPRPPGPSRGPPPPPRSSISLVVDDHAQTSAGARHRVDEALPDVQDCQLLAGEQLAGLLDRGLCVVGTVIGNQNHGISQSPVREVTLRT